MAGDQKYYPGPKLFAEAVAMGQQQRIDEDLAAAVAKARADAIEECAKLAASFPANIHGNLPIATVDCALQVAAEIASAIRALKPTSP